MVVEATTVEPQVASIMYLANMENPGIHGVSGSKAIINSCLSEGPVHVALQHRWPTIPRISTGSMTHRVTTTITPSGRQVRRIACDETLPVAKHKKKRS